MLAGIGVYVLRGEVIVVCSGVFALAEVCWFGGFALFLGWLVVS